MQSKIEILSKTISPNCYGIIWLTSDSLKFSDPGVYEFNYLLNGLVTKNIRNNTKDGHLFMSESFGHPFFISHNVINESADIQKIHQHLNVASNLIGEGCTVLIYNQSGQHSEKKYDLEKSLAKKFQHVKFKNLTLN